MTPILLLLLLLLLYCPCCSLPLSEEILSCHEEIEELLGDYLMDFASLERRLANLKNQLDSSEDLVRLHISYSALGLSALCAYSSSFFVCFVDVL